MKFYSQKNTRWRWQKLGTCRVNLGQAGCFVVSLANLADTKLKHPRTGEMAEANPSLVDWVATNKHLYVAGCLVHSKRFAELLDLEYNGKVFRRPSYPCIAETDHYRKQGYPQHFFIMYPDGEIIDPLDYFPKKKPNKYHIVSYRLFKHKTKCTDKEIKKYKDKIKEHQEKLEYEQKKVEEYKNKLKQC